MSRFLPHLNPLRHKNSTSSTDESVHFIDQSARETFNHFAQIPKHLHNILIDITNSPSKKPEQRAETKDVGCQTNLQMEENPVVQCPICLESVLNKAVSTMCGHIFCKPCISATLQYSKKCPMCNKVLTGNKVYFDIYFS